MSDDPRVALMARAPKYSEETLRRLNRDHVIAVIARREAEVEVQQEVVNRLDTLLDAEQRDLWDMERALNDQRDVLAQIDALPPLPDTA